MNFKEGTKQIKVGFKTLISPLTIYLTNATKAGGKLHTTKVGLSQISNGIKHIFGKTEEQKTTLLIEELLKDNPNKSWIKTLLKNSNNYFSTAPIANFSRTEYLTLIRDICTKISINDFVGIQPMEGPVGLSYFLKYTNNNNTPSLEVIKQTTQVGTRRLHARFSPEAAQELAIVHPNFANEFQKILAHQIANEIDLELFADIQSLSQKVPSKDKLYIDIHKVANDIARNTHRNIANFVIVSPESLIELQVDKNSNYKQLNNDTNATFKKVGTLNNIQVFLTLTPFEGKAIVGYKGNDPSSKDIDAGFVFNPYIPLMSAGITVDPTTFQPQFSLMTRYGKTYNKEDAANFYTMLC